MPPDPAPRATLRQRLFAAMLGPGLARYEEYIAPRKRALMGDLSGVVVELGPGLGSNFPYLPRGTRVVGLEPNPAMHDPLRTAADRYGIVLDLRPTPAESIDLPDASADAVVATLVLCSVADPARVLAEVRRVLRPGGRFAFIEHVAAPRGSALCFAQRLIRPAWSFLADGCRPDRDTLASITTAGFTSLHPDTFRVPWPAMPPLASPHVAGLAVR